MPRNARASRLLVIRLRDPTVGSEFQHAETSLDSIFQVRMVQPVVMASAINPRPPMSSGRVHAQWFFKASVALEPLSASFIAHLAARSKL
jgi:hypothetical protein